MFLDPEDDSNVHGNEQQLGNQHTDMPTVGAQLVVIDLAEGDQQGEEDKQGEYDVENGTELVAQRVESRNPIERQIAY